MKHLFLLALFLSVSVGLFAQNTIKGQVIDQKTKETLIGATIILEGTTRGASTQLDGSFAFKAPNGNYKLIISFIGYIEQKKEITVTGDLDLGTIELEADAIGLDEMLVVASYARDRKTPVSVSKIEPKNIEEKLGTKEFPEILKTTPSVYATKGSGGGFGDSRINLRGFSNNSIGVLINGVPVNDMENGTVYWSNWAGLSDVTRTMQVQRGLGASKLALSSVGGTINIITKSTDAEKGGNVAFSTGNDAMRKVSFTISTGMLENGWAVTASGAHVQGDGYIKGTEYEGWSYFLNIAKRINAKQNISYTVFGAPQWHNQRYTRHTIQDYRNSPDGIKLNTDYGILNGKTYTTNYNKYHKPQMSLNHTWEINEKSTLNTSAYASFGRGGGRQPYSNQSPSVAPTGFRTADGLINWQAVLDSNRNSTSGSKVVEIFRRNQHDWYGLLSSYNTQIGNLNITGGIDLRYYKGYHDAIISDLLGGKYYVDINTRTNAGYNVNRPTGTPLYTNDTVQRNYTGEVLWAGGFGQAEYTTDVYSAFISASVSNTTYTRYDYFNFTPEQGQKSAQKNFLNYSIKGGFNYNVSKIHNVFLNAGYFTRAPFFQYVYKGTNNNAANNINNLVKPERILSYELGYGLRTKIVSADVTLYRTAWMDRALTRNSSDGLSYSNITGLDALHQGIEANVTFKPISKLDISLMASVGDWRWTKNAHSTNYSIMTDEFLNEGEVYVKDIHVSDAAQTTASASVNFEVLPKMKIGFDYNYASNLYAAFNPEDRTSAKKEGVEAWKVPVYSLLDFNCKYAFNIGKKEATIIGNIDNLLNIEYISDAGEQGNPDEYNSFVYYGYGRTWSVTLKVRF